jgi:hypothetical protein
MNSIGVLALLILEVIGIERVESSESKRVTINQQQGRLVFSHIASLL